MGQFSYFFIRVPYTPRGPSMNTKPHDKKSGLTRPKWPCQQRLTWQKAGSTMEPFAQYVLELCKHYARLMIEAEKGD
jgi:hypothetical protein